MIQRITWISNISEILVGDPLPHFVALMPCERGKQDNGSRKLENRNALSGLRNCLDVGFPVLLGREPQKEGK